MVLAVGAAEGTPNELKPSSNGVKDAGTREGGAVTVAGVGSAAQPSSPNGLGAGAGTAADTGVGLCCGAEGKSKALAVTGAGGGAATDTPAVGRLLEAALAAFAVTGAGGRSAGAAEAGAGAGLV